MALDPGQRSAAVGDVAWPDCRQTNLNKESSPQRGLVGGRVQLFVYFILQWHETQAAACTEGQATDRQIDPTLYATTV